ncbi:hypothetical protein [Streptomyces gardneri]|uniref:hypothetical protein n=1 Tax=Streptomyces gardneri TaxID=66892 RepID=UPI00114213D2|nr:hypothetical protein [Streptomyces gardneri]
MSTSWVLAGPEAVAADSGSTTPTKHRAVVPTSAADTDPLFAKCDPLPVELRPAGERFPPPAGAATLADCEGRPQQAFRLGSTTWGVRFLEDAPLSRSGEHLLRRFAARVAARAEHTATRAAFTR